ncbi:MAG: hypothetical protein FWF15_06725 [Oscillospiraceae bacterium]|nr:hypothetical protein [Oscillospiraceae bacterium]
MLNIKNRLELLWDETMIDVSKTTATPKLHEFIQRECVLKHDEPWEGDACSWHNIVNDNGLYRMYYLGCKSTTYVDDGIRVCYAESRDGMNWVKPKLGIREYNGSKENNIILGEIDNHSFDAFYVFIDENPVCPADEKYKGVAMHAGTLGLFGFLSPDGINFNNEFLMTDKGYFDTLDVVVWDAETKKYMGYIRGFHGDIGENPWETGTRDIRYMESVDFKNWTDPKIIDFGDADDCALYSNCVSRYYRANHVLTGFPSRYVYAKRREWTDTFDKLTGYEKRITRGPRNGQSITDCLFMTSRDGFKWKRYDEAILRPGPEEPYNWIYGDCYPALGMIETPGSYPGTDNEISMYMKKSHWLEVPSDLYRYTMRIDGFVSYHATYKPQIITTKPFIYDGDELIINFSTSAIGYLYIKIKDEDGNEINSYEIFGDKIDRKVGFIDGSPSQLKGTPVVMEIKMSDADIYSFKFE